MPDVIVLSPAENGRRLKITREILDVVDGKQAWVAVPDREQRLSAGLCSQQSLANTHQRFIVQLLEDEPPAPAAKGLLARIGIGNK